MGLRAEVAALRKLGQQTRMGRPTFRGPTDNSRAGMSRSPFALRFTGKVGTSAMAYLARWRFLVAADRLVHASDPLSAIAAALAF